MSQWVKFVQCVWHLLRLFDLVRWPRGLHGSRLLSAGNLSHHLPVRGLPRPPGHHPGDTAVLHSEQTTDFLRTSAFPGGQGQHPRHPRRQPLWWKVSRLYMVHCSCLLLLSFLIAPIHSHTVFHRQEGHQPKEHSPTSYIHACFSDSSVALSQRHSSRHTNCGISGGFVTGRMTVKVPKDFPSSCFLFHFLFSSLITCEGLSPYLHPTYFHICLIQANYPLGVQTAVVTKKECRTN